MRLWSIHPKYLDSKGLVAVWREGLLAQKCLAGQTRGYNNHPQLNRFKDTPTPMHAIGSYLKGIYEEAAKRDYNFDLTKIVFENRRVELTVNNRQVEYEWQHYMNKIKVRDPDRYNKLFKIKVPDAHAMFEVVNGRIESWEIIS